MGETTTVEIGTWLQQITGALTEQFSMENLATILVSILGITTAFVLGWFAYRFATRKVKKAMTKGGI